MAGKAQLWSTGSMITCVKLKGWSAPLYSGTFEGPPEITLERGFLDVKNDLFGSVLPADRIYEGKEAMVSGVLNRFPMKVMLALQSVPVIPSYVNVSADDAVVGMNNAAAIYDDGSDSVENYGALMTQSQLGAEFWCLFPRWATQAGMIPGYHFLSAFLQGPDKIRAGSSEMKETVIFKCQRVVNVSGAITNSGGLGFTLNVYDHDMSSLVGVTLS